jgi:predicted ATPase
VNTPLRVAFAGASGTGKTTLAEFVAKTCGIPLNPVGSRSVAKNMGYDSPYDVDAAGKRGIFQHRLLVEKVAWERAHESFVTDRTVADNLVYTALHDVKCIDEEYLETVRTHFSHYTHVFFCKMSSFFHLGSDPIRVKERAYHEVFEKCLMGVLPASRQFYVYPAGSTVEDRFNRIKIVLGNRLLPERCIHEL